MIKNERSRDIHQHMRTTPTGPTVSLPPPSAPVLQTTPAPMLQTTPATLSPRLIDTNAIDITSLRGQFAWEKIPHSDTYLPVIFRQNNKYFCVRMLRKLLPDYPEDVIRRSLQYQYRKPISLSSVTNYEVELLNRINCHHSRWTFSRQLFTKADEIVRMVDFLPFYEYLRAGYKLASISSNPAVHSLRQLLPQTQQQQSAQRSSDFTNGLPSILRGQPAMPQGTTVAISSYPSTTDFSRETIPSTSRPVAPVSRPVAPVSRPVAPVSRPIAPASNAPYPPRPHKSIANPYVTLLPPQRRPVPASANQTPAVSILPSTVSSSSTSPIVPSSTHTSPVAPSTTTTSEKSSTSSISPSTTSLSTKSPRLHCGWLQVNKLYTPYVSPNATNHHLYKLPVSLLSFYHLLKTTSSELNDSKESLVPFEQTLGTSQELELINELCVKQNIQPFNADTKLIELSTFYRCCSANLIFVKELPLIEPKASICKEWASIVQINGGICRLRNPATLHEQTVPFIGNNLLKTFLLSSQCLSTASLTKPNPTEAEFLQLILFYSNMSINLRNAQLIDIESVRKEYNVDLILLFNDKFPLNVLSYQQQGNRSPIIASTSTAPTNTIAESTPPPSPPSPPTNPTLPTPSTNATSQMPLSSSTSRYYKSVEFHGHTLTAYICSGLGTNYQRECVSIKSLCNILCPNSPSLDQLEVKLLRLLRSKNVNRFRPQNQQSIGFTRLIDIKDAENHWEDIEQEMRSTSNENEEGSIRSSVSSVSNETSTVNTVERIETAEQPSSEPLVETNKGNKRVLDEPLEEEDVPVLQRINKRAKLTETNNTERMNVSDNDTVVRKRTIKLTSTKNSRKRRVPSSRTNKQSQATWVRKYHIEDCWIQLNQYDPIYDNGAD